MLGLSLMFSNAQDEPIFPQDDKEPAPAHVKIDGRKAWFLCTSIPEDVRNPVSVMVQEKIHQVTLSIRHMSDPFPIRGDGSVKIVKEIPNPNKEGEIIFQTLAQAMVPEQVQQALIILVPSPKGDDRKSAFFSKVLDLKDFRGGDYLYLNLSPMRVGITLGDVRSVLLPGEMKIQENRDIKQATNKIVSMHYQSPHETKWKMIVASTVVVQPTRREICIFHWDEKAARMDYRGATFPLEID